MIHQVGACLTYVMQWTVNVALRILNNMLLRWDQALHERTHGVVALELDVPSPLRSYCRHGRSSASMAESAVACPRSTLRSLLTPRPPPVPSYRGCQRRL